jgi:phosphohistidine swiveling domain-containing protein
MGPNEGSLFEPPGPGTWLRDTVHFLRPATRFYAETWPEPASAGFRDAAARHGVLRNHITFTHVNRVVYSRVEAADAGGMPHRITVPSDVVNLLEQDRAVQERARTAERTFDDRTWRADLGRWDERDKPSLVADHRRLVAVDTAALSCEALVDYVGACQDHLRRGVYAHHRYTIPSLLPLGDLLASLEDWTGQPAADVFRLLRGSSEVSLGAASELRAAATAIRADRTARTILFNSDGDASGCLDRLRRLPGPVRTATTTYLDLVGYRPMNGHEVGEPYAYELPAVLVRILQEAVEATTQPRRQHDSDILARVRDAVPADRRSEFDALLAEARFINRLRDERDLFADGTAEGIARRAVMAAGRVLTERGVLADPTHLVEADFDEIRALMLTGDGPSAGELADRADYGHHASPVDAPVVLGPPPSPTPLVRLPPAMARVQRAVDLALDAIFATPPTDRNGPVQGQGVGGGTYIGPARVVVDTADLSRIRPGDVLVTTATSPAFNVVLPLISAVVTDWGALLSHAAIVAREAGIPAAVGCGDATSRIPDGATVRVDGDNGVVSVLT